MDFDKTMNFSVETDKNVKKRDMMNQIAKTICFKLINILKIH